MEVSNADRVVFPDDGITKGEVVDYYRAVGERLFPYLAGRALTVERYPKGIGEEGFMQKNTPAHYPDELFSRHSTPKEDGGVTTYPVIESGEAIVYLANQGVITFHVPPVRVDDVGHPDWVVWDLDPPAARADLVREAAGRLREVLEAHGIPTVPMTSGSKGYHLRVRLVPDLEVETMAGMARAIAELGARDHPDLLTTAFRKKERGKRVFVDWLRNAPYATAVAPWSLRPRSRAPVATPLDWEEVDSIDPDGIRLGDALARADPWERLEAVGLAEAAAAVEESLQRAGIELEPFHRS